MHKNLLKTLALTLTTSALLSSSALSVSATAPERLDYTFSQQDISSNINDMIDEINNYITNNPVQLDLKEQKYSFDIPLSNGTHATMTYELKKVSDNKFSQRGHVFDAKIGVWDFISTIDLGLVGSMTATTTVNIYHVPSSNESGTVRFNAYNGRVSATPAQFCSISGTSAQTQCKVPEIYYETTGYVGVNLMGSINYNFYYTQTISFVDNASNKDKISVSLELF